MTLNDLIVTKPGRKVDTREIFIGEPHESEDVPRDWNATLWCEDVDETLDCGRGRLGQVC